MRTPLLSSLVIWHQVMHSESWKTSALRFSPSPPNEICEGIAGRCWSLYKIKERETGNMGYVKSICMGEAREAKHGDLYCTHILCTNRHTSVHVRKANSILTRKWSPEYPSLRLFTKTKAFFSSWRIFCLTVFATSTCVGTRSENHRIKRKKATFTKKVGACACFHVHMNA